MRKYETTYEQAFQPKYSSNYHHSRRQSARYSDAARNSDQVHLLFYNENMAPSKYIKHRRKSSGVQTGDSSSSGLPSMYEPCYNDCAMNYAAMNSMFAWPYPQSAPQFQYPGGRYGMAQSAPPPPPSSAGQQQQQQPPPSPAPTVPTPYLIIDQSPIPGVQTGSPGLQVPAGGFEIPFYTTSAQRNSYPQVPAANARYSSMVCPNPYVGDQWMPPPSRPTSVYYAR